MLKASDLRDAMDSNTPTSRLIELSRHENKDVRIRVARNVSTPSEIITRLAFDSNQSVRITVVKNPSIRPELLEKLADDEDSQIRYSVTQNSSTELHLLEKLSKDADENVRRGVASLEYLPKELYMVLAADKSEEVLTELVYNNKVTRKVLEKIVVAPNSFELKRALTFSPKCPLNLLAKLSIDDDLIIRSRAIEKIDAISKSQFKKYVKELGFAELVEIDLPRQWVLRTIAGTV